MRRSLIAPLALAACGYQEVELSDCWPTCGDAAVSDDDGGEGPEELGRVLNVDWVTPHSAAIGWTGAVPGALTSFRVNLGALSWTSAEDPQLGSGSTTETTILGLEPARRYSVVIEGQSEPSGPTRWVVARGTVLTPSIPGGLLSIYDEGDAPPRTVLMNGGAPDVHRGTAALWFTSAGAGGGDAPSLSGLSTNVPGLLAAANTAYLEFWVRLLPDGTGIGGFGTRLTAGGQGYVQARTLVPPIGGWHRVEVPLFVHRREGGAALDLATAGPITGLGLEASWPAGGTIILDELALRY